MFVIRIVKEWDLASEVEIPLSFAPNESYRNPGL
jgi:hypothetical protein